MKNLIIAVLLVSLMLMTWLAWRNAGIPTCITVTSYADGRMVCLLDSTQKVGLSQ